MNSKILITDVGSTTTKAIFLEASSGKYMLRGMHDEPTTVEKPDEDVRIGVYRAVVGLQQKIDYPLLAPDATPGHMLFAPDVVYLSTSSAGGGLQILVVGLTTVDSAASAERTAFGAGGVLLDTFAIDDQRSAVEQMSAMQSLQPDIVLFSGGIDGGALSGLIRLGEILSYARPRPKYGEHRRIPLVFAGNKDAVPMIQGLFKDIFELHVVPNLRPTMKDENPGPARNEIRNLFMENVMERAPGYLELKKLVGDPILPTPLGVMQALQLLSREQGKNIMAVDIGGATTDVFSNLFGEYYRTVSANLGMSYNLCNVLAQAGWENVARHLPKDYDEVSVRNYAGNKMLHPTRLPADERELAIEQVFTREALRLAKAEHMSVCFNRAQLGFLDRMKEMNRDMSEKLLDTIYLEKRLEGRKFQMRDFDLLIGAGGTISHAPKPEQAFMAVVDGLAPMGVTEIWRDRHFITPHLGKLADVNPQAALQLLISDACERLGVHIRPTYKPSRKPRLGLTVDIAGQPLLTIQTGEFVRLENPDGKQRKIIIRCASGILLEEGSHETVVETDLPVYFDLRENFVPENVWSALALYEGDTLAVRSEAVSPASTSGQVLEREIRLPYAGTIHVQPGDRVEPKTLVAENRFDPPRIGVLSLFTSDPRIDSAMMKEFLSVKLHDEVKAGQKIFDANPKNGWNLSGLLAPTFVSPMRGVVEDINDETGVILLREIQDYSDYPVKVDIAGTLGVKPKQIRGYLLKRQGDFVLAGEMIARCLFDPHEGRKVSVESPSTGVLTEIDLDKGTVTIQYRYQPSYHQALVPGTITRIEENYAAVIEFQGREVCGILGFGGEAAGKLQMVTEELSESNELRRKIAVFPGKASLNLLNRLAQSEVAGLVAAGIDELDMVKFLGKEIGVAITGKEKIPFPIVLTEGFGDLHMRSDIETWLRASEKTWGYIEGRTQIRAGVVRPRIVVVG